MTPDPVPSVALELPAVLRAVAGWKRVELEARTVRDALEAAFARTPVLRHHMTLASGELRPHVLCVLNDDPLPRGKSLATPLRDGDEILIHQAISGG